MQIFVCVCCVITDVRYHWLTSVLLWLYIAYRVTYLRAFVKHPEYGCVSGDGARYRVEYDVAAVTRPEECGRHAAQYGAQVYDPRARCEEWRRVETADNNHAQQSIGTHKLVNVPSIFLTKINKCMIISQYI